MLRSRLDPTTASVVPRLLAPIAAVVAMATFATFEADPVARAETAYLALATGMGLAAAAAVARRPSAETVGGALLVTAAVWALPHGPARGAVALALTGAALAVAAVRRLPSLRDPDPAPRTPDDGGDGGPQRLPVLPVVALALGLQAFLRGAELLGPVSGQGSALRGAALFVAFPLAGAAAVLALARQHGRRRALLAGAAVLLAGPGFRPATVTALVALAAGSRLLARDPLPAADLRSGRGAPTPAQEARGAATFGLASRAAAGALLAAPFVWDPRAAAAGLAAGLTAGLTLRGGRWRWLAPVAGGAVLAVTLLLPGRALAEVVPLASLAVLAVPAVALPERGRVPAALAALLLAVATARGVLVEGPLAPAVGLAALAVPRRGPVLAVQGTWSGILLAAGGLLSAYPWLRGAPLAEALGLLGLETGPAAALLAAAGAFLLAGLAALSGRGGRALPVARIERAAARAAALAVLALAVSHLPPAGAVPVAEPGMVLDATRRSWSTTAGPTDLPARGVGAVVVDSSLANAADLPRGTPVATLRLREAGRPDRTWTVRVGDETGEWAAGRPDLRAAPPPVPGTWAAWVAEGGGFFGRRYRSVHRLAEPARSAHLELTLRPDLPPDVTLTVFHLELRP